MLHFGFGDHHVLINIRRSDGADICALDPGFSKGRKHDCIMLYSAHGASNLLEHKTIEII
jgi:hypothetical protein